MLHMCLYAVYKWLTSCVGIAAYTAHLCMQADMQSTDSKLVRCLIAEVQR